MARLWIAYKLVPEIEYSSGGYIPTGNLILSDELLAAPSDVILKAKILAETDDEGYMKHVSTSWQAMRVDVGKPDTSKLCALLERRNFIDPDSAIGTDETGKGVDKVQIWDVDENGDLTKRRK